MAQWARISDIALRRNESIVGWASSELTWKSCDTTTSRLTRDLADGHITSLGRGDKPSWAIGRALGPDSFILQPNGRRIPCQWWAGPPGKCHHGRSSHAQRSASTWKLGFVKSRDSPAVWNATRSSVVCGPQTMLDRPEGIAQALQPDAKISPF